MCKFGVQSTALQICTFLNGDSLGGMGMAPRVRRGRAKRPTGYADAVRLSSPTYGARGRVPGKPTLFWSVEHPMYRAVVLLRHDCQVPLIDNLSVFDQADDGRHEYQLSISGNHIEWLGDAPEFARDIELQIHRQRSQHQNLRQ